MDLKGMLKGNSRRETVERHIILGIIVGVVLAGTGIATTVFETRGIATAVALVGSFITFVFTVILVFYWLLAGDR